MRDSFRKIFTSVLAASVEAVVVGGDFFLLETGDFFLLETGDYLILE